jgi:N6-adenosine-specific RNA methylase IME4
MSAPEADNLPYPPVPNERMGVVAIDPPWHFKTRAAVTTPAADRSPQKHYPTASIAHLKTIPMQDILLPDAWVAMWITHPLYARGVQLILAKAWGLEISGLGFTWIKLWNGFDTDILKRTPLLEQDLAMGGGYTTRKNSEVCLLLKRGNPKVARRDIREVIISPRREHSRKPEDFYRRMEHFCHGPRLDMFGGGERPGWTYWGWPHFDHTDRASGVAV